jgi:hypothetical protein
MERGIAVECGFGEAACGGRCVKGAFESDFSGAAMQKGVFDDDALGRVAACGFDGVPVDGLRRGGLR